MRHISWSAGLLAGCLGRKKNRPHRSGNAVIGDTLVGESEVPEIQHVDGGWMVRT
jgi:hypothetical protein